MQGSDNGVVYLLGAGASRGYEASPTGVRPPLATGLLAAYLALDISGDIDVKVGTLVNYVRDRYGIAPAQYASFDMDAEQLMTDLRQLVQRGRELLLANPTAELNVEVMTLGAAYSQTLFVFTHILNEICNGPLAHQYVRLLQRTTKSDTLVTFNWDILLDRALEATTSWLPDSGYGLTFDRVMDDGWREQLPAKNAAAPALFKLHGSTNWFSRWFSFGAGGERMAMVADRSSQTMIMRTEAFYKKHLLKGLLRIADPTNVQYKITMDTRAGNYKAIPAEPHLLEPCLFISGRKHFDTWHDLWREGYERYTYFYPPNLPDGIPTMPLIVAPTRDKEYSVFGSFLEPLWQEVAARLSVAGTLVIIGYSFPETDLRARDLVRGYRGKVTIVNPDPEPVREVLVECSIPLENVSVFAGTLEDFNKA